MGISSPAIAVWAFGVIDKSPSENRVFGKSVVDGLCSMMILLN